MTAYRWLLVLLLLASAAPVLGQTPSRDSSGCRQACYDQKSRAYQSCRAVPPRDREARVRCFHDADLALRRCLQACR